VNRNVMYVPLCDILSKVGASHMNARDTITNGWRVKENDGEIVVFRAM
jgi:hypothetical protein